MATPMTASQVVAQLKKWGVHFVEIPGWATHNRNHVGAWGPVHGFVLHHTGATVSAANARTYAATTLYNGWPDLPGPLCQFSIGLDGTLYLVGWGRANHAGGGDPAVLQRVIAEDYTGQLHPTRGNSSGVDGNSRFYGVEVQYDGSHPMSDAQYRTVRRLAAAICDWHGWTEKSVIGHGEWSSDKWDPGHAPGRIIPMPDVRADIKATLAAGPNSQQEDDMTISDDDLKKIAGAVHGYHGKLPSGSTDPDDAFAYLRGTNGHVRDVKTQLSGVEERVGTLSDKLDQLAEKVDALAALLQEESV